MSEKLWESNKICIFADENNSYFVAIQHYREWSHVDDPKNEGNYNNRIMKINMYRMQMIPKMKVTTAMSFVFGG